MACPATENKNVWPFVGVRIQCKIIPNEELSFLGSGVEQGTLNIFNWRWTIQISFFSLKNRHVATWGGGGGYLTLICSQLSHPQTFLVKYTRNYNFLVGPNKQLLSSNRPHAVNELIRFSFFSLLSCVYQLGQLRKRHTGKDSIKTLEVFRILMEDKHVWKKIITTDPETHSKCMNNFVKQSFADSKQNMIVFF